MKIWQVKFAPRHTSGNVAIVCTRDDAQEEDACAMFRKLWQAHIGVDPEPVTATLLDVQPGYVNILSSGNY